MYHEACEVRNGFITQNDETIRPIKILLVDDEPKILKGLSLIIHKMSGPASTTFCADSAQAALDAIAHFDPDVVITDICMPGMDGFELIDRIRELSLCKHYIILTGYSDFEFARTAIKKRAMDYLMKPVDEAALRQLLLRAEAELAQERENYHKAEVHKLQDFILHGVPLDGDAFDREYQAIFPNPFFLVTVCRCAEAVSNEVREALKLPFSHFTTLTELIEHPSRRYIVLLSNLPADFTLASRQALYETLCRIVRNKCKNPLGIGLSELGSSILQLNTLYHTAMRNSLVVQYFPEKSIGEQNKIGRSLEYLFNSLKHVFEYGNMPDTNTTFSAVTKELTGVLRTGEEWNTLYSLTVSSMKHLINSREGDLPDTAFLTEVNWTNQYGSSDPEKVGKAVDRMLASITAFYSGQNSTEHVAVSAKEMVEYIRSHYMDNISLVDMAKFVHLHPKYVSALFSKNTGKTFVQYLNSYRISKAKELMMDQPELPQDSIASMVGYENQRNYYKVFKKICGCTPGEHRKKLMT